MAANCLKSFLEACFEPWLHRAGDIEGAAAFGTNDRLWLIERQTYSTVNSTETAMQVEEAEVKAGGRLDDYLMHQVAALIRRDTFMFSRLFHMPGWPTFIRSVAGASMKRLPRPSDSLTHFNGLGYFRTHQ